MSADDKPRLNARLTRVIEQVTKQVYCSQGDHHSVAAGGFWKIGSSGRRRFICAACRERMRINKQQGDSK